MVQGWPRTLAWTNFTAVPNPGPGQFVALNGQPIVARVSISIMFYIGSSPRAADGRRFNSVDVRVVTNRLEYVPSRIPHGQEAHYLAHEQGHMDLMGMFARELECALLALNASSPEELTRRANSTTDEGVAHAQMYAINVAGRDCLYDRETNHGMNQMAQTRWNTLIARNLRQVGQPNFLFRT